MRLRWLLCSALLVAACGPSSSPSDGSVGTGNGSGSSIGAAAQPLGFGGGLSPQGGTITGATTGGGLAVTSGKLGLDSTGCSSGDGKQWNGTAWVCAAGGGVTGTGTAGTLPVWTSSTALGDYMGSTATACGAGAATTDVAIGGNGVLTNTCSSLATLGAAAGTGTANTLAMWTTSTTVGDGPLVYDGSSLLSTSKNYDGALVEATTLDSAEPGFRSLRWATAPGGTTAEQWGFGHSSSDTKFRWDYFNGTSWSGPWLTLDTSGNVTAAGSVTASGGDVVVSRGAGTAPQLSLSQSGQTTWDLYEAAGTSTFALYNSALGTDVASWDNSGNTALHGALDLGTHQIHNVTDPSSAQDAATQAYVQAHIGASGALTSGTVPRATGAATLADSSINDSGTAATFTGSLTSTSGPNTFGETEYSFTTASTTGGATTVDISFARARGVWLTNTGGTETYDGFGFTSGTPTDGQRFMFCGLGSGSIKVTNENTGETTAGRRFDLPAADGVVIQPGTCRDFIYDSASGTNRWRTEGVITPGSTVPISSNSLLKSIGNNQAAASGVTDNGTTVSITESAFTMSTVGSDTFTFGNGASDQMNVVGAIAISGANATQLTTTTNVSFGKHVLTSGSTPTLTSCGTSPSLASGSTDMAGTVTVGTSAPTGVFCNIHFANTYTNVPVCTISQVKSSGLTTAFSVGTATATDLPVYNGGGDSSSGVFSYICIGH